MEFANKLISIIVPIYKSEDLLKKCIKSVLFQTYSNFELILVDDESPDCCPQICDEYAKKDKRIKVIHKKNGGASDARNAGLDIAKGDYISFLDSDDYLESNFLLNAVQKIGESDLYISGITMYVNGDQKEYIPSVCGFFSTKDMFEKCLVDIPLICLCGPCCKLFCRKIIEENKIRFDVKLRCGEDTDFNLSYNKYAKSAYIDDVSFYKYYRGNPNSLFSSYNYQYYEDHVKVYDRWLITLNFFHCDELAIKRFKEKYVITLIGNIFSAYIHHCDYKEKKRVINLLCNDKIICSKIKIKGKMGVIKFLLKCKFRHLVYFIFNIYFLIVNK